MRGTKLLIACFAMLVATAGQVQGAIITDPRTDFRGDDRNMMVWPVGPSSVSLSLTRRGTLTCDG